MKFIRRIIALPLVILRDLLSLVPIFNKLIVMRWICLITDDAEDALAYINTLIKLYGPDEFKDAAIEQMIRYKDSRFAVVCAAAYWQKGENEKSRQCMNAALEAGCSNPEHLLGLRFFHVDKQSAEFEEILEQMLSRRDVHPNFSRLARTIQCWRYVETGDIANAEIAADRLLEIEDNPMALLTKWVAVFQKNPARANHFFEKARRLWTFDHFEAAAAEGWHVLNDAPKAAQYLKEAMANGFDLTKEDKTSNKIFAEIMDSEQYRQG